MNSNGGFNHKMKSGIYASLDIGTTSMKVIVAEVINGQMNVIGVGNERANGLNRGMIVNIEEAAASIREAVRQAEDKADVKINELIVGIPATDIRINTCYASLSLNQNQQEITNYDVGQVVEKAIEGSLSQDREVVSVTADEFMLDGFDEIKDPRGMIGNRIEFKGIIASSPRSILHNIRKAVERAGYLIRNIVLSPQAMGQVALTEDERNFGSILIDMGGGQTSVAVIHDNQLKSAHMIPEGGFYVTKDISIVLNTSIQNAEKLKRDVGHAYYPETNSKRTVSIDIVGQKEFETVKESYIAEIIEARIAQIFEQLNYAIKNIGASDLPAGITISGGASSLPGIQELAEEIFDIPVRMYVPDFMGVRYPTFTNAIGLVVTETNLSEVDELILQTVLKQSMSNQASRTPVQNIAQDNRKQSANREVAPQEVVNEEDKISASEKIKNFFSGFFE